MELVFFHIIRIVYTEISLVYTKLTNCVHKINHIPLNTAYSDIKLIINKADLKVRSVAGVNGRVMLADAVM